MVENTSSSLRREMTQVVIIVFTSSSELLTSLRRKKVSFADLLIDLLIKFDSSGGCIQLPRGQRNWENICDRIAPDQQLVTMFSESYSPINCR